MRGRLSATADVPLDRSEPNAARIYDYLLGGKTARAADRDLAGKLEAEVPGLRELARVRRRFILAAVTWAMGQGIRRVADLGAGLPADPSVHATARACGEPVKVAYVDKDPMVLRRLAAAYEKDGVAVIEADVSDPAAVLADLREAGGLDGRVLLLLGATLSAMEPEVARDAVKGYAAALKPWPGSLIAISCASYRDKGLGDRMAAMFAAAGPWVNHGRAGIESFFAAGKLRIVHERVMNLACWPTCPLTAQDEPASALGGIGVVE